jgi:hypothetical protein
MSFIVTQNQKCMLNLQAASLVHQHLRGSSLQLAPAMQVMWMVCALISTVQVQPSLLGWDRFGRVCMT